MDNFIKELGRHTKLYKSSYQIVDITNDTVTIENEVFGSEAIKDFVFICDTYKLQFKVRSSSYCQTQIKFTQK